MRISDHLYTLSAITGGMFLGFLAVALIGPESGRKAMFDVAVGSGLVASVSASTGAYVRLKGVD